MPTYFASYSDILTRLSQLDSLRDRNDLIPINFGRFDQVEILWSNPATSECDGDIMCLNEDEEPLRIEPDITNNNGQFIFQQIVLLFLDF